MRILATLLVAASLSLAPSLRAQTPEQQEVADLFSRANDLRQAGKLREALTIHHRAMPLTSRAFGPTHNVTAAALNDTGLLLFELGDYTAAEPLIAKAIDIWTANNGREYPSVARGLSNLGVVYKELGQFAKAEPCFRNALKLKESLYGRDHEEPAIDWHHLGTLFLEMGAPDDAEKLYRRALEIFERRLGENHSHVADSLNGRSAALISLKRYSEAEPLQRRCLKIRETILAKDHHLIGGALSNLALIHQHTGRHQEAEALYLRSQAIAIASRGPDHPSVAHAYYTLAANYAAMSDGKRATENFDRSRRIYRKHQAAILPSLSEREQIAFLEEHDRGRLHTSLGFAVAHRSEPEVAFRSANWLLNGKGLAQEAFAEQLRVHRQSPRAATSSDPWIEPDAVARAIPEASVFLDFARFWRFKEDDAIDERYAVWITFGGESVKTQLIELGDAAAIDLAVRSVRDALVAAPRLIAERGEAEAEQAIAEPLEKLSLKILRPLEAAIGEKKTWIVSPDSALWLVPWSALRLEDGKYAAEKYSIRCVLHGRDLLPLPSAEKATNPPAIFADPHFDLSPTEVAAETSKFVPSPPPGTRSAKASAELAEVKWARLPGTATEAQAVRADVEAFTGTAPRVYTGRFALEGVLKAFARPQVLVLSTHGFFLPDREVALDAAGISRPRFRAGSPESMVENPLLRCGLVLAGANKRAKDASRNDGLLTGVEVVGLDLQGCRLVVLSACETGIGEVRSGHGVAGLRQAFQTAGAEAVAASLWQVPDRETTLLMSQFFSRLSAGDAPAAAMCQAQRQQIDRRRERGSAAHPYYWAAFTVTGRELASDK